MMNEISNFLMSDIRMATAIMVCALGLVFSSKAGVVNIGAEGMMLTGALMGVLGSYWFNNAWLGVVVAMLSAMLLSLLFAFFTVTVRADQTVVGAAINTLGLGLTTTLSRVVFGLNSAPPKIPAFSPVAIPGLSKLPAVGQALFNQPVLVYIAFWLVPAAWFVMYKTDLGLKIRAVGEHPKACDTVGINVFKIRYGTILFSGLMAGLAGVYCSLGLLSYFTENMVAGRGFMAVAAVVFGSYNPIGAMGAALLFGAGEAIRFRLQASSIDIPYQFVLMVPYLLTVLALCGVGRKPHEPAAMGLPYRQE